MKNQELKEWSEPLARVIEAHIQEATLTYQNLTETELTAKPTDGGWSAAQCLAHLNTYGDFYLPKATEALNKATGRAGTEQFKSGFLGKLLTNTIKPENKLKLKAFKGHRPAVETNGAEAVAQFIENQERWLQLLREVKSIDQLEARVKSSITPLIRFKLGDVFLFMKAHDERHLQQADRALAEASR